MLLVLAACGFMSLPFSSSFWLLPVAFVVPRSCVLRCCASILSVWCWFLFVASLSPFLLSCLLLSAACGLRSLLPWSSGKNAVAPHMGPQWLGPREQPRTLLAGQRLELCHGILAVVRDHLRSETASSKLLEEREISERQQTLGLFVV